MSFKQDLQQLLNVHCKENKSGTPDFILAQYLSDCLKAFDKAVNRRDEFYMNEIYKESDDEV